MTAPIWFDQSQLPPSPLALLLQDAPTTAPGAKPAGSMLDMFGPLLAILVVFWFVMIGPERKNRKKREAMLAGLKKGDRVMTTGGMYGTIVNVQAPQVTLAIADGVRVRFSLQAVQGLEEEKVEAAPANQTSEEKS